LLLPIKNAKSIKVYFLFIYARIITTAMVSTTTTMIITIAVSQGIGITRNSCLRRSEDVNDYDVVLVRR
jgi:hypothetical protein